MRTTIDLDPEVHKIAFERARREHVTLSQFVNDAVRQKIRPTITPVIDDLTGLPVISVGHPVTSEEVADALDD